MPVELIVNGQAVETQEIDGDGKVHDLAFDYTPERSSWVALRILPSSHTNPVFVEVDGKPIRASRKSAQWCLDAVDVCWKPKETARSRPAEQAAAAEAFAGPPKAYAKILAESRSTKRARRCFPADVRHGMPIVSLHLRRWLALSSSALLLLASSGALLAGGLDPESNTDGFNPGGRAVRHRRGQAAQAIVASSTS